MHLPHRSHPQRTSQSTLVDTPLVAATSIQTPTVRKKRTVVHTPAIIETIIEEPDYSPVIPQYTYTQQHQRMNYAPRQSYPSRVLHNHTSQTRTTFPLRSSVDSRNFGVKVTEDLRSIRPPTMREGEVGCCQRVYVNVVGCCRLFRCPLWICCLIPLLLVLALVLGSYIMSHQQPQMVYTEENLERMRSGKGVEVWQQGRLNSGRRQVIVEPLTEEKTVRSGAEDMGEMPVEKVVSRHKHLPKRRDNKEKVLRSFTKTVDETVEEEKTISSKAKRRHPVRSPLDVKSQTVETTTTTNVRGRRRPPPSVSLSIQTRTKTYKEQSQSKPQEISTPSLIATLLKSRLAPTFQESPSFPQPSTEASPSLSGPFQNHLFTPV